MDNLSKFPEGFSNREGGPKLIGYSFTTFFLFCPQERSSHKDAQRNKVVPSNMAKEFSSYVPPGSFINEAETGSLSLLRMRGGTSDHWRI